MPRPLSLLSTAAFAALSLTAQAAHAQTATNLLVNPGAETGTLAPWTVGGDSNPNVDNGTFDSGIDPLTGLFDFTGGSGDTGTLTQTVALTGTGGLSSTVIDSGTAQATVSFWEQGLNQGTPSDDAFISLSFLDGSGNSLGSPYSTPEIDSHVGFWTNYTESTLIPIGARTANYTMNFIRHVGSDNDGFVDDNSLTLAAAPEPSQFAALAIGLLGLGALALKARKRTQVAGLTPWPRTAQGE